VDLDSVNSSTEYLEVRRRPLDRLPAASA
jgi:hypothetical protein